MIKKEVSTYRDNFKKWKESLCFPFLEYNQLITLYLCFFAYQHGFGFQNEVISDYLFPCILKIAKHQCLQLEGCVCSQETRDNNATKHILPRLLSNLYSLFFFQYMTLLQILRNEINFVWERETMKDFIKSSFNINMRKRS